ncbi:putative amino acid transporter, transmembrane domain-containing protein [Rosa chinensis]|uniref:Putative amino acid transporter, transmembrane domain-containing protein n=1 Tax=Rosa chinensis TaxID=74649 RepID=A0A2P6R9Y7_ROSCH|nr:amino acid transporter AVT1D isoform X1 [Rosa chinensis]PRQ43234.1 putative amino acid transporter, transmembrane domain-containing protein [Rosa chinensis]
MSSWTKLDEDLGPERGDDDFLTDDEENQAHRNNYEPSEAETESEVGRPEGIAISAPNNNAWPQSYWQSIDMYTNVMTPPSLPSLTFMRSRGPSFSSLSSFVKGQQAPDDNSSQLSSKLLASEASLEKEGLAASSPPTLSAKNSVCELPPPKEHSCSFSQAVLNGINVLCGMGLITTPYAIKEGGWLSLILLALFGVICCYTGILLMRCLESCPGLRTYPDIGQAAFGSTGRLILSIILYLELYGACVEFLTMMGDNLAAIFPNTHIAFAGIHLQSHEIFAITATLVVLPTVWLQNLSLLSYLSVGGVGASILVAFLLLWVGAVNQVGFHHSGSALNLSGLSVTIGIYGFGYAGHSVFPNIYTSMRKPSQFPAVLLTCGAFCFFMYTGVAICGYLMFGDSVRSQFTLNMPEEFVASKIAVWTTIVNPMTKYALTITPVALSLEELFPVAWMGSHLASILTRTVLVLSTLVVALSFPFFGAVMALMGSLLAMLVAIIFPGVCYLILLKGRLTKSQITTCVFVIMLGVLCSIIGTYSSITKIAEQMD